MPGAIITVDQSRPGPSTSYGSPGVARNDLWVGWQVQLLDGAGGNGGHEWSFLYVPSGSAVQLAGADQQGVAHTTNTAFTPDLPGTYRVRLVTNGGGPGNIQIKIIRVRYDVSGVLVNDGWALPAFGEQDGESNYPGNLIAWAEVFEFIFADIRERLATNVSGSVDMEPDALAKRGSSEGELMSRLLGGYVFDSNTPVMHRGIVLRNDLVSTGPFDSQTAPFYSSIHHAWDPMNGVDALIQWDFGPILDVGDGGLTWGLVISFTEGMTTLGPTPVFSVTTDGVVKISALELTSNNPDTHQLGTSSDRVIWKPTVGSAQSLAYVNEIPSPSGGAGASISAAAGVAGGSGNYARQDHTHQISTGTPSAIGTANSAGSSNLIPRVDHVHAHGNIGGGSTYHTLADSLNAGFMSSSDYNKLAGIAFGADVTSFLNIQLALLGATGDISVNGQKITNLGPGSAAQDAATYGQLLSLPTTLQPSDTAQISSVTLAGLSPGVMTYSVTLFAAVDFPLNGVFMGIEISLPSQFTDGGSATYVVRVGISGDESLIIQNTDVSSTTTVYFPGSGTHGVRYNIGGSFTGLSDIIVTIESNQDLNTAQNGLVNVRLIYSTVNP